MKKVTILVIFFFSCISSIAYCTVDPLLADEICEYVKTQEHMLPTQCSDLTENKTHAKYVDLNDDGTKELIFIHNGASCGEFYWVFQLDKKIKWKNVGVWCGCEWNGKKPETHYKIKKTKHNDYYDIWT